MDSKSADLEFSKAYRRITTVAEWHTNLTETESNL